MTTLVKEQAEAIIPEAELARPAAAGRRTATWAPTRQDTAQGAGLMTMLLGLLAGLDRVLAGPPMTQRERIRRELAEAQTERDFGLLAR
jgi:hypothetical protein